MAYVTIRDDAVWASHIQGDPRLKERIHSLSAGEVIELEVDGIIGQWEKMRSGRDGRPTPGIRPIGPMLQTWKQFQKRRGETVPVREARVADSYLAALGNTLSEWDSPEDEEAFRDL